MYEPRSPMKVSPLEQPRYNSEQPARFVPEQPAQYYPEQPAQYNQPEPAQNYSEQPARFTEHSARYTTAPHKNVTISCPTCDCMDSVCVYGDVSAVYKHIFYVFAVLAAVLFAVSLSPDISWARMDGTSSGNTGYVYASLYGFWTVTKNTAAGTTTVTSTGNTWVNLAVGSAAETCMLEAMKLRTTVMGMVIAQFVLLPMYFVANYFEKGTSLARTWMLVAPTIIGMVFGGAVLGSLFNSACKGALVTVLQTSITGAATATVVTTGAHLIIVGVGLDLIAFISTIVPCFRR